MKKKKSVCGGGGGFGVSQIFFSGKSTKNPNQKKKKNVLGEWGGVGTGLIKSYSPTSRTSDF